MTLTQKFVRRFLIRYPEGHVHKPYFTLVEHLYLVLFIFCFWGMFFLTLGVMFTVYDDEPKDLTVCSLSNETCSNNFVER